MSADDLRALVQVVNDRLGGIVATHSWMKPSYDGLIADLAKLVGQIRAEAEPGCGPHHLYRGTPIDCGEYEALIVRPLRTTIEGQAESLEEWEGLAALMRKRERPWIERWQAETGKPDTLPDYGEFLGWLVAKLDAGNL